MDKKTRKTKYEVLRIIAMFMIVLAHYAYHGGVMFEGNMLNQVVGSVLAIGGKLGVNLFVIIGSYFLVDKVDSELGGGIQLLINYSYRQQSSAYVAG